MKKYAFLLFLPLAALSALAFVRPAHPTHSANPAHPTAFDAYISFKGVKQGQFKAATNGKGGKETEGWFKIETFDLQGEAPTDGSQSAAAQPAASGKRTHKPINIVKEVDGASPLLLNAHANNEALNEVVIETVGRPSTGAGEKVYETITLTNATISQYKTSGGKETISIIYEQLMRRK